MPFIGFNFPSHTHDVIPFLVHLVSKGLSEFITVTESLLYNKFQVRESIETITINEALGLQVFKQTQLAETVTISEALTRVSIKARVLAEGITISEALAKQSIKARALTDTITVSEAIARQRIVPRAAAETVTSSEALARPTLKARTLSDTITVEKGVACYVPLFVYPNWWIGSPYNWTPLINAITNNPTVKFVVAININSGPDTAVNTDYSAHGLVDLRNAATASGADLKIIGYNSTLYNNGTRSAAQIDLDTDRWFSFYGTQIDGIFFDEMNNITGSEAFYLARSNYAKSKNWAGITWGNPGTSTIAGYVPTVDTLVIVEADNSSRPNSATMNTRTFNGVYPREKFCSIIYNQSSLDTAYIDSTITPYIGYYWVTDDILPNPYDSLPTYLASFMAKLATIPAATTLNRIKISVKAFTQTVTISEALARLLTKARTITNTITISDDLGLGGRIEKALAETISMSSDAITMVRNKARAIAQTVTNTGTPTVEMRVKARTTTDTITISEALTKAITKAKDLAETIGVSEALTKAIPKARALAETIGISEALTRVRTKVRTQSDTIAISESLARALIMARSLTDTLTVGDTLSFPKTIVKDITQSISITDSLAQGSVRDMALTETITVIDSVARQSIKERDMDETVDVSDEVSKVKSYKPEDTGGAGGVPLTRWEWDLNDAGVYHRTRRNVIGQKKTGGNK